MINMSIPLCFDKYVRYPNGLWRFAGIYVDHCTSTRKKYECTIYNINVYHCHHSHQEWVICFTRIFTQDLRFNPLRYSDNIRWHRPESALAQSNNVCHMAATSHYLIQCGFLVSEVQWHSPETYITASAQVIILCNKIENGIFIIALTSLIG